MLLGVGRLSSAPGDVYSIPDSTHKALAPRWQLMHPQTLPDDSWEPHRPHPEPLVSVNQLFQPPLSLLQGFGF